MNSQSDELHQIVVPRDNVSDESYVLVRWIAEAKTSVSHGEVLGEFETSKSIFELSCEEEGVFYPLIAEGAQVAVGQVVAVVADRKLSDEELGRLASVIVQSDELTNGGFPQAAPSRSEPRAKHEAEGASTEKVAVRFSKAAQALVAKHGVDPNQFAGLGLVRGSDVERHLAEITDSRSPLGEPEVPRPERIRGSVVVIFGAGGHARVLLDLLAELRCFTVLGFLDRYARPGQLVSGHPVLGRDDANEMAKLRRQGVCLAVNAIGGVEDRPTRPAAWERIRAAGFGLPALVHPSAVVDASATLGEGAQVLAGAYVGASAVIGDNCIINTGAVVAHDSFIADHAHIAPGAVLAGRVRVGRNSLIGMGATVYMGVNVGADVTVANGVNIFSDVRERSVVHHGNQ